MLGVVPPGDERISCNDLVSLGERIAGGLDFRRPSEAHLDRLRADVKRLAEYARFGYESQDAPTNCFVRRLRECGLTFEESRGIISLIFLAGTLTTAATMPRILALLVDANATQLLTTPEGISTALAEGLRFTTPVPATIRIAQQETIVGSTRVQPGTRLILLTCNMARDPRMFEQADTFVPTRKQPPRARNLWFGAGPHFCLGFAIAQRQMQMVFTALGALDGELAIVRRRSQRGVLIAGYRELHVRLMPRAPRRT
jgi:cytochrome P450